MIRALLLRLRILPAVFLLYLASGSNALADDVGDCLDDLIDEDYGAAKITCGRLEADRDPEAALVLGWYEMHARIGTQRLEKFALRGIDGATPAERESVDRAVEYFRMAAEGGIAEGQYRYALAVALRRPKPKNIEETQPDPEHVFWLKKAAEQDHPAAIHMLGSLAGYPFDGFGMSLQRQEYLPYLERAAALGFRDSQELLALFREAEELPGRAAAGDADAQREYAIVLMRQQPSNPTEALTLMKKAADAGDQKAMLQLAYWLWPDNPTDAESYLVMAAELDSRSAYFALGNLYACQDDVEDSRRWFQRAHRMGHPETRFTLADLDEWGTEDWDCRFLQETLGADQSGR